MTLLMVLASMMVSTTYAQEIYKTVADVPMVQLNNGILMPQFGLGTFLQPSDSVCEQSCLTALKAGYRHIDTAHTMTRLVWDVQSRRVEFLVRKFGSPANSGQPNTAKAGPWRLLIRCWNACSWII